MRIIMTNERRREEIMKKRRALCALLLAALMGTSLLPTAAAAPAELPALKLVYDEPASATGRHVWDSDVWEAATLPIGNGVLGANVYGEVGEELLTINEETLWSGGRGSVANYDGGNPDPAAARNAYDSISQKLLKDQTWGVDMESLKGDSRSSSGYDDGYQPLGDLKFNFGHQGQTGYERALDLDNGLATVRYKANGTAYTREYFASNPHNVIVAHFTSDKNNLNFTTSFASKQNNSVTTSVNGSTGYITVSGKVANNGLLHNTQIAVVADSGNVSAQGKGIHVANAKSVTVYLTAATDYANQFSSGTTDYYYRSGDTAATLDAKVKAVLDEAVQDGYTAVKKAHTADYTRLYDRVKLDLGQTDPQMTTDDLLSDYRNNYATPAQQRYLEVLLYQYGRYLLIAGSRENSQLPTTLQGIWNDHSGTDWNSDIHTNINLEMNYWLSGSGNLTECAKPLVNYMSKLKEPGGRTVKIYTGSDHGIMAHTQNTPFGYTAPGWEIGTWGWSPAAATWLMQNCYDYYQYSTDTGLLRSTIYPMMKDQVLMYEDLLKEKGGRKVMPIALSPEIGPVTCGNTFEQSLIWQLYTDTIEAAKFVGETDQEFMDKCNATIKDLKPIEIGDSGQIKEWYSETYIISVENTSGHRHLSNLLGLFPGDLISSDKEIVAAKISLNNKNFGKVGTDGNTSDGGWTYGQMIPSWARVGDGANAYFCVNQMIKTRLFENLWDYHSPAIFQIDGNYGYSAGVAEMLLQSNLGYINLLPAISKEWASGSVSGLLAEGGYEVSMTWKDSKVTEASITAQNDGQCSVKNPFGDRPLKVNGQVVTTDKNGVASFSVAAGQTYTLSAQASAPALNLGFTRADNGHVTLTWDAQPGVTYTVTRREIAK